MEQHRSRVEDYEQYVGAEAVERIPAKAKPLRGLDMVHVNSTYYGRRRRVVVVLRGSQPLECV